MKFTVDVPSEPYVLFNDYESLEATEEGLVVDREVKEKLEQAPEVEDRRELIDFMEPADILLIGVVKSRVKGGLLKKLKPQVMKIAQRSLFTSSKLVVSEKQLIGYGLSKRGGKNPFSLYSSQHFLRKVDKAILLRHHELNDKQRQEIVNWAMERQGMDYASDQLLKTFWNRLINMKLFQFLKDGERKEISSEDLHDFFTPLICSSIIAFAYESAEVEIKTQRRNLYNTWPVDFLKSPSLYPVAYFEEQG